MTKNQLKYLDFNSDLKFFFLTALLCSFHDMKRDSIICFVFSILSLLFCLYYARKIRQDERIAKLEEMKEKQKNAK